MEKRRITRINVGEVPRMVIRLRQLESLLQGMVADCPICHGNGSYTVHDEVTGSDLWTDCYHCRQAREALETSHD